MKIMGGWAERQIQFSHYILVYKNSFAKVKGRFMTSSQNVTSRHSKLLYALELAESSVAIRWATT
jgi:hypothetical protein